MGLVVQPFLMSNPNPYNEQLCQQCHDFCRSITSGAHFSPGKHVATGNPSTAVLNGIDSTEEMEGVVCVGSCQEMLTSETFVLPRVSTTSGGLFLEQNSRDNWEYPNSVPVVFIVFSRDSWGSLPINTHYIGPIRDFPSGYKECFICFMVMMMMMVMTYQLG